VKVGGATFTGSFKVETVMPNRLKINLSIADDAIRHGKTTTARFESNWLHGAPARNLKVKVDAILTRSTTSFKGFEGYHFDDPADDLKQKNRPFSKDSWMKQEKQLSSPKSA